MDQQKAMRKGFKGTEENSKTKICTRWEAGECRFGDRCNFAHGYQELRHLPPRSPGRGRGRGRPFDGPDDGRYYGHNGGDMQDRMGDSRHHHAHPLGMRSAQEREAWIASGCPVRGPDGWTQYESADGEKYYHHSTTNETQWDPPESWKGPV